MKTYIKTSCICLTIILLSFNVKNKLSSFVKINEIDQGIKIETLYGDVKLDENDNNDQLIIDLINSQPMQRLKKIHQYGPSHYVKPHIVYKGKHQNDYTRFEHSIGVFVLLRMFKSPFKIQVAGLLHDISHTAFSHVADFVFENDTNKTNKHEAYQDIILKHFLIKHGIAQILAEYDLSVDDVVPNNIEQFNLLKNESGKICADRLEYTLKGSYLAGLLKRDNITKILQNLNINRRTNKWYFTDIKECQAFGYASLNLSNINSGSIWNAFLYKYTALFIKRAFEIDLISKDDFLYESYDDNIWFKLISHNDERMLFLKKCVLKPELTYQILEQAEINEHNNVFFIPSKFRGINPLILIGNQKYTSLTKLNEKFQANYYGVQYQHINKYVLFINGYSSLAPLLGTLRGY